MAAAKSRSRTSPDPTPPAPQPRWWLALPVVMLTLLAGYLWQSTARPDSPETAPANAVPAAKAGPAASPALPATPRASAEPNANSATPGTSSDASSPSTAPLTGDTTRTVAKEAQPPDATLACVPGLSDRSGHAPLADLFAKASPSADPEWQSEQFSEVAGKQMAALVELGWARDAEASQRLAELVAPHYEGQSLRPSLREVFRDGTLVVLRQDASAPPATISHRGRDGALASLRELLSIYQLDGDDHPHFKFKIVRTALGEERVETTAFVEVYGPSAQHPGRKAEQTATWRCVWVRPEQGHLPLLQRVEVSEMEEVLPESDRPGAFVDLTEAILGNNPSYHQQLVYGADYWYGTVDVAFGIHHGNQGLALGDINGDGREDLFVCQPAGLPTRMYVQQPDGTLRDVSEESGLDWLDASRSALFADFDNDGDQDLAASLNYTVAFFENDGSGHFTGRTRVDVFAWPASLAAADFDNDGDVDLYICGYNPRGLTAAGDIFANPVPYHDANNGAPNFMMRNDGEWNFLDVTREVGFDENNFRFSFAATWEDYDNDGDQDIYVANDFGRNNLYRNELDQRGRPYFRDVAREAGVEDIGSGMSVAWGDYNRDGRMDLYVSNMFSSAGSRITTQAQFKPSEDGETRESIQRTARGNSLFLNQGDGTFRDASVEANVTLGRWAWGSLFTDLNNDGWEDLYVANGFFTTPDPGDL